MPIRRFVNIFNSLETVYKPLAAEQQSTGLIRLGNRRKLSDTDQYRS